MGLRSASVHPGSIHSDLGRSLTKDDLGYLEKVFERASRPAWKTVEQGAATQVWAAVAADPRLIGGRYLEDCAVASLTPDNLGLGRGVRPHAQDPETAAALWDLSEKIADEPFPLSSVVQRHSM